MTKFLVFRKTKSIRNFLSLKGGGGSRAQKIPFYCSLLLKGEGVNKLRLGQFPSIWTIFLNASLIHKLFRGEREYVIDEDFNKAVRKVADSKKLETKLDYKPV